MINKPFVTRISRSEAETMIIASELAKKVKPPVFIRLSGNLGAGKTVFAKGFAEGMGIDAKKIKSPTYTFVREYEVKAGRLYHFDFYRIEDLDDLMSETLREIFDKKNAIILMEWPEHVKRILPKGSLQVKFDYIDEKTRKITFSHD